jgi:phospholipid/cholesterol/gamma-HCH transport system substrate-binding protein
METQSHSLLVAGVLVALLAALFAYIAWASPNAGSDSQLYDIRFDRSVAGLAEGSPVSFSGVAVGRIEDIDFDPVDPQLVRVRILITDPEAPILQGTIANLHRDLFGGALISLDGAAAGAPPIRPRKAGEIPIIPAKKDSGLLGGDTVSTVEKISATAERLNRMLTPAGQQSISARMADVERRSARLAARGPALAQNMATSRTAIRATGEGLATMGRSAETLERRLAAQGSGDARAMRQSLREARAGMARLDASIDAMEPRVRSFSRPGLHQQVRDMRGSARELGTTVQQIDRSGIGPALSPPALPDHKPR